jgi:hypothetical protein
MKLGAFFLNISLIKETDIFAQKGVKLNTVGKQHEQGIKMCLNTLSYERAHTHTHTHLKH